MQCDIDSVYVHAWPPLIGVDTFFCTFLERLLSVSCMYMCVCDVVSYALHVHVYV